MFTAVVQTVQIVLQIRHQELRDCNHPLTFWCFRLGNHIPLLNALIGFIDGDRLLFQVNIPYRQGQKLSQPHPCPVKQHKGDIRHPLVHDSFNKLVKLLFCPKLHFIGLVFAHASSLATGITLQVVIPYCEVENGVELVVDVFKVSWCIALLDQRVLPGANIRCLDVVHPLFSEVGQQFLFDDVPFTPHGMFPQPGGKIVTVDFDKIPERHIKIHTLSHKEFPKPFLCFPLGSKPALGGFSAFSLPIRVTVLDQPLPCFGVFFCFHTIPPMLKIRTTASPDSGEAPCRLRQYIPPGPAPRSSCG